MPDKTSRGEFLVCLHCRIARGSGQPGDFDASVIIVFAASDRAAWRRSIGIGIGAIVVYGSAPAAHSITVPCPPASDEAHSITVPCPPASDEDIAALAGAALGSPSVMSKSAIYSRRPSAGLWPSATTYRVGPPSQTVNTARWIASKSPARK